FAFGIEVRVTLCTRWRAGGGEQSCQRPGTGQVTGHVERVPPPGGLPASDSLGIEDPYRGTLAPRPRGEVHDVALVRTRIHRPGGGEDGWGYLSGGLAGPSACDHRGHVLPALADHLSADHVTSERKPWAHLGSDRGVSWICIATQGLGVAGEPPGQDVDDLSPGAVVGDDR